ncbi:tyrosine-type recombinase/integrase [Kitasatospora purpeofusca]|uniref:tyrosine-type recombinase/integrase n=1 Tax=Kitasatospora purpeofusca TaxID=67352 RepID=UPI00386646BE|nr:tyrosine-type recombinase/integrase [Kitasatospora purpeofusca]
MTYAVSALANRAYRAEKAILPDGTSRWVIVDHEYRIFEEALSYLDGLRGADRSINTERTYAGRIALYLSYCAAAAMDWSQPTLPQMALYLNWLVDVPLPRTGRRPRITARHRSHSTANAHLGTTIEFLRWSCLQGGAVPAHVVTMLAEPRYVPFLPPNGNVGPEGERRMVRVKAVKFRVDVPGFEFLTWEQIGGMIAQARHARDRFLLALLRSTAIRIGEALGLHREDMHLLADSTMVGCKVPGPHIHIVRRRNNRNGALAKARRSRWIPVDEDTTSFYADYQHERQLVAEADDCDMVFVNLFRAPLGEPMKYANTYELFKRLAKGAGFNAHPHLTRHGTISRWIKGGMRRDVAQDFAGHVSEHSMKPYLHTTDEEKRAHARRVHEQTEERRSKS